MGRALWAMTLIASAMLVGCADVADPPAVSRAPVVTAPVGIMPVTAGAASGTALLIVDGGDRAGVVTSIVHCDSGITPGRFALMLNPCTAAPGGPGSPLLALSETGSFSVLLAISPTWPESNRPAAAALPAAAVPVVAPYSSPPRH